MGAIVSTELELVANLPEQIDRDADATMNAVREVIQSITVAEEALDAKAKLEMAKAWLRTHNKLRDYRRDLLTLEIEALVRIAELDGLSLLSPRERKAAAWLAGMSPAVRDKYVTENAQRTSATGMCEAIWKAQRTAEEMTAVRRSGADWVAGRDRPSIRRRIQDKLDHHSTIGKPFELAEIVDPIAEDLARDIMVDDLGFDKCADEVANALREGIAQKARQYLRNPFPETLNGTVIPRYITIELPDSSYKRVEIQGAIVADVKSEVAMRERQVAEASDALERYREFADLVDKYARSDTERVVDVIAKSIGRAA